MYWRFDYIRCPGYKFDTITDIVIFGVVLTYNEKRKISLSEQFQNHIDQL